MDISLVKRERSINFTQKEVITLIKLVEANKHIIESRRNDAATWAHKNKCWNDIEFSFNAASKETYRSAKTLRIKYDSLKKHVKKKSSALLRGETKRPGEGSSSEPVSTPKESTELRNIILDDSMNGASDSDSDSNMLDEAQDSLESEEDEDEESSPESATNGQLKTTKLKSEKDTDLGNPNPKQPFDKIADTRMKILLLQKKIVQKEYVNRKRQWSFEEQERRHKMAFENEERRHKKEMWALEKKLLLKKFNDENCS